MNNFCYFVVNKNSCYLVEVKGNEKIFHTINSKIKYPGIFKRGKSNLIRISENQFLLIITNY